METMLTIADDLRIRAKAAAARYPAPRAPLEDTDDGTVLAVCDIGRGRALRISAEPTLASGRARHVKMRLLVDGAATRIHIGFHAAGLPAVAAGIVEALEKLEAL
jgi:pyrimidine operon attenuation protein/uracil phosphoribosyltransferase